MFAAIGTAVGGAVSALTGGKKEPSQVVVSTPDYTPAIFAVSGALVLAAIIMSEKK